MKLLDWRRAHGLSQHQLAMRVGIKQPTIAKYEAGKLIPGRDAMQAISQATGGAVAPNDFFDLSEAPPEKAAA